MPVDVTENLGAYPELAEVARRLTGGLTSRVLARKTGVSYDTVQRILNGDRPKADTLLKFAEGCRFDEAEIAEIMRAAKYTFMSSPTSERRALYTTDAIRDAIDEGASEEQFERIREPEADEDAMKLRLMAAYDKLPFRVKTALIEQTEATVDAMYAARADIVGKKADRLADTPTEEE